MTLPDLQIQHSLWGIPHPPESQTLGGYGLGQRDLREKMTEHHHLIPQGKSLKSERLKWPAQDRRREGQNLIKDWPLGPCSSSAGQLWDPQIQPGVCFLYGLQRRDVTTLRVNPHFTDGATKVQKGKRLRKFDSGVCICHLTLPATLLLVGGCNATVDALSCISTWELLVITEVVPWCCVCLLLTFHFHFRDSIMLPTLPQWYILYLVYMLQSTQWGRLTPNLTAQIISFCWISEDGYLHNRFTWLRIQCFLNSLLGNKYLSLYPECVWFSLKHSPITH